MDLSDLRKEYRLKSLHKKDLDEDPMRQFEIWFKEAQEAQIYEPNAMALATADSQSHPSCRMVLLKHFDLHGFYFFTNQTSRKALQIESNPFASLLFFWKELERQIQIEGAIVKTSNKMAADYFKKRPKNSQLAALASSQSTPLASRAHLEERFAHYQDLYKDKEVPTPEHWAGYQLIPSRMEFWQGRESRLHDRFLYQKENGTWSLERLFP